MNLIAEWIEMKGKQQGKSEDDIKFIIQEVMTKCKELGLKLEE